MEGAPKVVAWSGLGGVVALVPIGLTILSGIDAKLSRLEDRMWSEGQQAEYRQVVSAKFSSLEHRMVRLEDLYDVRQLGEVSGPTKYAELPADIWLPAGDPAHLSVATMEVE